jgi:hypothetical protein|tara:strand:- start:94 stop:666 length:573 start_codon:yes stop_codon:yes gene_type:complete
MTDIYKKNYLTGLEFLNEGPYAERAEEMRALCHQLGEEATIMTVAGEDLAYMLMEMYNRGRNEGAVAALLHMEPTAQERKENDLQSTKNKVGIAMKNNLAALLYGFNPDDYEDPPCSDHPDAPHGFDRNGSHNEGQYLCECANFDEMMRDDIIDTLNKVREDLCGDEFSTFDIDKQINYMKGLSNDNQKN